MPTARQDKSTKSVIYKSVNKNYIKAMKSEIAKQTEMKLEMGCGQTQCKIRHRETQRKENKLHKLSIYAFW